MLSASPLCKIYLIVNKQTMFSATVPLIRSSAHKGAVPPTLRNFGEKLHPAFVEVNSSKLTRNNLIFMNDYVFSQYHLYKISAQIIECKLS